VTCASTPTPVGRLSITTANTKVTSLEVDLIVERIDDGSWIGIEVKLGSQQIDEAGVSLLQVCETRLGTPASALLVVTAPDHAYRRPDGVYVVPLGMLGP